MSAPLTDRTYWADIVTGEEMVTMKAARYDEIRDRLAAAEAKLAGAIESVRLNADARGAAEAQRDTLAKALRRIADGAESNPPHEVATVARAALAAVKENK